MSEQVNKTDVLKHYLASLLIYGLILVFIILCPLYNQTVQNPVYNYISFFVIYYILYALLAYPIFLKTKPESILKSQNVTILKYIKRLFQKGSTEEKIRNITPNYGERQALTTLFVKVFFGVYCINLLFNEYYLSMDYNIEFLKTMFSQMISYASVEGIFGGFVQYINDTADMWIKIMIMISTTVLAFSYITDTNIFKNKIKYTDTSFLGLASCLMCYYPIVLLTNKIFPIYSEDILPVGNIVLKTTVNIIAVLVTLGSTIAIIRLGSRAGNLTNRGIVTGFPYNIVRHPDYTMQMLYVIILSVPVYFLPNITIMGKIVLTMGVIFWIFLYFLRAVTEERNLIQDDDYKEYIKKVPYRFIPKLF